VYCCSLAFRDERIGRLLHSVVEECVDTTPPEDEFRANGLPESRFYLVLRFPLNQGQGGDLGDVPQTGELP
jgi:hypothetical protein